MAIYLCLIFAILLSDIIKNKKTVNFLFYILTAMFTIISAIRYQVGTDYGGYVSIFNQINSGDTSYVESGYYLLNYIIGKIGGSAQTVIALSAIITNLAFAYTIKKNVEDKYIIYTLFIYVCGEIYFCSMNALRQYVAIGILLIGYEFFKQKKYKSYLLIIGLAMLFHTSAVFALFPFLLSIFKNRKRLIDILSIIINTRWGGYLAGGQRTFFEERYFLSILKLIVPNAIWFLTYIFYVRKASNPKVENYMLGWFFYVMLSNMFYGINAFQRIYSMFEYYVIYLIPFVIELGKTKVQKVIIKFFITLYYFVLTSYAIFYLGSQNAVPYQTIFSAK